MDVNVVDQVRAEVQGEYLDFLDDEEDQAIYHRRVKDMLEGKRRRILVNLNDLRKKNPKRANRLLQSSGEEQLAFQNALKEYVNSIDPHNEHDEYFIGFEGSFGNRHLTPRTLTSRFLNNLVCVEGIVTQCSLVRVKLVQSVHYCPATQKMSERKYTDLTSLNPVTTAPTYPTKDADGNLLETEYGLSTYKDHQTLMVQEMPEKAPAGQLPRGVDVICDNDLADKCKPGDRVQIVGLYRCLPGKQGGFTTGVFRTVLIANNISHLSKDTKLVMSQTDISNCRKLAKKKNIFELLSRSLAPTIHGHEYVKKAILCMLLGGVEKILPNGTRLRGDINILLIGDPSVAKSQLLRYVLGTAPRAIATTGRGSSGVGLTAAVSSDHETGERRLEAGAMVLADRGIVCIDEFDKMSDIDRTAIHEVMEQGRVTIAKAGIHAQLNARCSVLAAANPVYGKYDQYKPPMENIGLQDSLLSRFDLLFVMLDVINNDIDSMIADHVVRIHRYRNPDEQDGEVLPIGSAVDILTTQQSDINSMEENSSIYEKYDPLLHGNSRSKSDRIFSVKFMRMYIHIAKTLKPVLTDEASEAISEEYSRLRSQDAVETGVARTQPVTVRTLETLIRLATAHAKARLSCSINLDDAQAAIELVQYAYFKKQYLAASLVLGALLIEMDSSKDNPEFREQEVLEKERKRRRRAADTSASEFEGSDTEADSTPKRVRRTKRATVRDDTQGSHDTSDDEIGGSQEVVPPPSADEIGGSQEVVPPPSAVDSAASATAVQRGSSEEERSDAPVEKLTITAERLLEFKRLAAKALDIRSSALPLEEFTRRINEGGIDTPFSENEFQAALDNMSEENQLMVADNKVYRI